MDKKTRLQIAEKREQVSNRSICLCGLLSILIAMLAAVSASAQNPAIAPLGDTATISLENRKISQIRFTGVRSSSAQYLQELIQVKTGEPVDRRKVRASILALYDTGEFSNVEVKAATESDNSAAITFVLVPVFFIGNIDIIGRPKYSPSDTQLINASKLDLGKPYSVEAVQNGITAMQRLMEDFGFYNAQITYKENPHPDIQQMDLTFVLTSRARARVGKFHISGDNTLSESQAQRIAKMKRGTFLRNNIVSKALERLRAHYTKRNRLEAQISLTERKYNSATNTVDYTFTVVSGPTIDIHSQGTNISEGKLKKYVPVFEENAIDEDLLNEGRRNLRDYLQTQGFFAAKVDVKKELDPKSGHVHVVFAIDRGERYKLVNIKISGNKFFLTDDILERMTIQTSSAFISHGRFSQGMLARDVESIKDLYQSNGFQRINVTSEVNDSFEGNKGQLQVVFRIDEGLQTVVNTLEIVGNSAISKDEILSKTEIAPGQSYSDAKLVQDRDQIVNLYFQRGFPKVEFETLATPLLNDPTKVDVVYKITEGKQFFVDRVLVSGTNYTRPHIVAREFHIRDGAPLNQDAMVDSQRRLYDLGIFNQVDMAIQNPDGGARYKNLLYNLKEARRWTMTYGLGMEIGTGINESASSGAQGTTGVSPNGSFDLTRINLRGRDQSLILKSRYGRFVKRGQISFDSPRWFDLQNWRSTWTLFYDKSRDVNTYASERIESSVQLTQVIDKSTQLLYGFSYRRVRVDPSSFPAGYSEDLIPIYSRPVRVGMPSLTWVRDHRDDPIVSSKGSYNTLDIGIASGAFGSEANFGRVMAQNSTYYAFGKRKRFVFARATRVGVESPYGKSVTLASAVGAAPYGPSADIPLPERFFVGGGNSHRGFSINQAGPRDPTTGGAVGGNAMFINNLELRLPAAQLPFVQDNLSFVVFHDMGNAFGKGDDLRTNLFRWKQRDTTACQDLSASGVCDLNYISHAVGAGVRYRTPIGPIRIDLGYNLNPPVFPVRQNSDGVVPHVETGRHLNVFFSIGQTF